MGTVAQAAASRGEGHRGGIVRSLWARREASIAVVALFLALLFRALNPAFFSLNNLHVIFQLIAEIVIISAGEVVLLVTGEIDLSVGNVYALAPFIMYFAYKAGIPLPIGAALGVLVGVIVGAINGLITVKLRVPSFIATLGTLFFINGLTLTVSGGFPVLVPSGGAFNLIMGAGSLSPFLWALAVVVALSILLTRTPFGLYAISAGSNPIGAREVGIPVDRVKILTFMLVGGLGALTGIIEAVRITSIDPLAGGTEVMFQAVAAAVIGGTSLYGGSGTIVGALLGTFVIAALNDGLTLMGVSAYTYDMILGAAILVAMILNTRINALRRG